MHVHQIWKASISIKEIHTINILLKSYIITSTETYVLKTNAASLAQNNSYHIRIKNMLSFQENIILPKWKINTFYEYLDFISIKKIYSIVGWRNIFSILFSLLISLQHVRMVYRFHQDFYYRISDENRYSWSFLLLSKIFKMKNYNDCGFWNI